ncbi:9483_t:CDS:1, partial [Gigaspora rosea]
RFLSVWLNSKLKKKHVVAKAKAIISSTAAILRFKKLTISQIIYINNAYIVPKLVYMLQIAGLAKGKLDELQRPILKLAKTKAELATTTAN